MIYDNTIRYANMIFRLSLIYISYAGEKGVMDLSFALFLEA